MHMDFISVLLNFYITFFKIFIWTFLLDTFLTRKFSLIKTYVLSMSIFLFFNIFVTIYYSIFYDTSANLIAGLAQYAFIFVIALLLFKNKIWTLIAATASTIFIYIAVQILPLTLAALLPERMYNILTAQDLNSVFKEDPLTVLIMFFLLYFFIFILCFLVHLIYKRLRYKEEVPANAKFMLLPFSQGAAVLLYYMSLFHDRGSDFDGYGSTALIVLVIIAIFAFTDFSLFKVLQNLQKKYELEMRLETLEQLQSSSFQQYSAMNAQYRKERVFRHDINNKLMTTKSLLRNKNYSEAEGLLDEISTSFSSHTLVQFCENPIVNTILNNKNTYAQSLDIKLEVTAKVNELKIGLSDLCSVVSNILDNAIEATEKLQSTSKEINADISLKGDYFIVKCQNPIEADISLKTTKPDSENHGYGISILNSICERYEGSLTMEQHDNQFAVTAVMRNKAVKS